MKLKVQLPSEGPSRNSTSAVHGTSRHLALALAGSISAARGPQIRPVALQLRSQQGHRVSAVQLAAATWSRLSPPPMLLLLRIVDGAGAGTGEPVAATRRSTACPSSTATSGWQPAATSRRPATLDAAGARGRQHDDARAQHRQSAVPRAAPSVR
jgi:hypothetical protein